MTGIELSSERYWIELLFDGALSQIWPMLLLPALAALISDKAARLLPPTRADWRIAAALAAFPGLVMLTLIGMVIGRAYFHLHYDGLEHLVKYHVTLAIALALLGRAGWRVYQRNLEVKALVRLAHVPSPRLREAAAAVSIRAMEIPDTGCECFVAGVLQPTAFVSRGTVSRMNDAELRAALHHERAHAASHDPAMLQILSFLRDLAPGTDRALTAYRQARERRADLEAARREGACVLASALLAVARPSALPLPALGMAGPDAGTWRLQAILGVEPQPVLSAGAPLILWASFAVNLGLIIWPLPHVYVAYRLTCYGAVL